MTTTTTDHDEVAQLRVPPHSLPAEHSVLGSLLNDNSAWDRVADLLAETDFYRYEHKLIFAAIGRLVNAGKPADVVTVFESLRAQGTADDTGGLPYLNEVAGGFLGSANIRRHAEIVRGHSVSRLILGKLEEANQVAVEDCDAAEKLDRIGSLFAGIEARNSRRAPKGMDEVMVRVMDNLNAAAEGSRKGWKTGIPGVDWRLNGGLQPGKLIVLAARPSVGKSSLAAQFAMRVAKNSDKTLFLSQEMEVDELGERALANESRVDYSDIQNGKLTDDDWAKLAEAVDVLGNLPMWIDDEPGLNLRAIAAKARSIRGLSVLVVDYLQLSEGEGDTRSAQVGSITRGLKKLAKQMGICVIALSQLNRDVEKRPDRRPQMSDLRDSGEIEQDADTVIFLWPMDKSEDDKPVRHVGIDFAKNRKGKKGSFVLTFEGARQLWGESMHSVESFSAKKPGRAFE